MVFVSIHNVEKLVIDKFWLDSGTFVFSKHSEPFDNISSNSNSKSE